MPIHRLLAAAALAVSPLSTASADNLRPIDAESIDLGGIAGVAYYTVEPEGFRVVTTLAEGSAGTPIRVVATLAPGQSVGFSTPLAGALEISREGDHVLIRSAKPVSN